MLPEITKPATTVAPPMRLSQSHPRPVPTQTVRPFSIDEIFFSTTDRKGLIRSGNRVFTRVSGYSRADLVGRPHNIVRHPDMPRAVFKVFWDELEAGRPIAAYVKNMARDGSYYWVMATAVPCNGGYLSVRIKPCTAFFDTARALYAELLALEHEVEAGDTSRRQLAIETTSARLLERLGEAGFDSYLAFQRAALMAELKQREGLVEHGTRQAMLESPPGADRSLVGVLAAYAQLDAFLGTLVGRLDDYAALNEQLAEKAQFVRDLADDVSLFSLNALLAATRVREGGATLEAVASLMQVRCDTSASVSLELNADVAAAMDLLSGMQLPVAMTKLQAEILIVFMHELLDDSGDVRASADDLGVLTECLIDGVSHLSASIAGLDAHLHALVKRVASLSTDLSVLRALEVNGRIEAAHALGAESVVTLFDTIGKQTEAAGREMNDLNELGRFSFADEINQAKSCQSQVGQIREHLAALGCE